MKKAKAKSNNRYLITVNLFLIAILMVVAVYAWFSSNAVNRVDTYDVQVQADDTLQLSFDKTDENSWSETLNLADLKSETDSNISVLDAMKFVAITGDGNNFYIPTLEQKTNYAKVTTSGSVWRTAEKNKDYLNFKVYMRSKDPVKVYLSSDSYAKPVSSVVTGGNCGNPSTYATGDNSFSKDCIVGALRVAGFDASYDTSPDKSSSRKFVWITNPEYHLNNEVGSNVYTMDVDAILNEYSDGTGNENYDFEWNNPYKHYYYEKTGDSLYSCKTLSNNVIYTIPKTYSNPPSGDTTLVATLNGVRESDGYYHSEATFSVWIEGCDTEARRALVDGKFNLSLIFDTFSADTNNESVTVPEDIMNGVSDDFE